jgi:hypothetical protein
MFMTQLVTPGSPPPAIRDVVEILEGLEADGSPGARALCAVPPRISLESAISTEDRAALEKAVYTWMAGTLSEDDTS